MRRLVELRPQLVQTYGYPAESGLGLIWLKPWDGAHSLRLSELDPFYVEVCRRIRLIIEDGRLAARGVGTKVPRISIPKDLNGITGDPWTPIDVGDSEQVPKALTIDRRGFHYRRLVRILFHNEYRPAPLQEIAASDEREGLMLVCRALVRGQGKTEGWHERVVPISAKGAGLLRRGATDRLAALAGERIDFAASLSGRVLRYALMVLFQNGPDRDAFKPRDFGSVARAELFLARFYAEVDRAFFEDFWLEAEHIDEPEPAERARREWLL